MKEMNPCKAPFLDKVPEGWNFSRLKFLRKSVYKGNGISKKDVIENGDTPCIRYGEIYSSYEQAFNECISRTDVAQINSPKFFDYGDILFAGTGELIDEIGKNVVYLGPDRCLAGGDIIIIKHDQEPRFLNYLLNSAYVQAQKSHDKYKLKVVHISDYSIDNLRIYLPCIEEQRKIADYLDATNLSIDNAIERNKAIIEKLHIYRENAATKAVIKGIQNAQIKPSGEEWLGDIPSHWKVQRTRTLFKETNERGNDNLPILMVSINSGISNDEVPDEERTRSVKRSEDKSKYKRMLPGDIVYNMMRAWQGAFGAARVEGMVSPAYVTIRPIVELDSRYYEYLMRTDIAAQEFKKYSRGIRDFRLRLYYSEFRDIKVCVPPIEEQREIADYLDNLYEQTDKAIKQKYALIEKLEEYRKSIIYNAVTGKMNL